MGYYTEFRLTVKLHAPEEVLKVLEMLVAGEPLGDVPPGAEFLLKSERFPHVFESEALDHKPASQFKRTRDGGALLSIHSHFKDYDHQIDLLCRWIAQYVSAPSPLKVGSWRGDEGTGCPIYFYDGEYVGHSPLVLKPVNEQHSNPEAET